MKNFNTLSECEILALAISREEEDERVYSDFPEACAARCTPKVAIPSVLSATLTLGLLQSSPLSTQNRCQVRDQFLQADFALLIRLTSSQLVPGG
jgi:hypothetical protein